ncbi:hypothetical protein [Actinophytocola oryzae]|uniref:Tripartite tricarboxylate transporter TctB family protein n=1 Tax=Actinophytocola oryzae TaxID=502181 RepID=A0A4R7W7N3_9PSEU|nr:hypothetical protein [Actinophytocola oryzae]TDV57747.1 hypothetical protein CLV71_101620 [Actinophytocola oryzae]
MNRGTVWTSLAVASLTLVIMVYAGLDALTFSEASMWFPAFVAIVGAVCALSVIVKDVVTLVRRRPVAAPASVPAEVGEPTSAPPADDVPSAAAEPVDDDERVDGAVLRQVAYWLGWMVGLGVLVMVIGGFIGMTVWLLCFLRLASRQSWLFSVIGAFAAAVVLFVITNALDFYVPQGIFA